MIAWWESLSVSAQFFWVVAVFASSLQVILLLMSALGGADPAHDMDAGHAEIHGQAPDETHSSFFSLRSLVAFAVGFGWAGVLGHLNGWHWLPTGLGAVIVGIGFMMLAVATLRFLLRMQDSGTLRYANAVGNEGKVYVTVPPQRAGRGQIETLLQSRLITAEAVTDAPRALPPLTAIRVLAVTEDNLFVVEALDPD